jgi:HAE1 family hydrophobic/amphiphilic exporter-1
MGVALVGGMVVTTLVGVFLYPALYYLIARIGGFEKKRERMRLQAEESL